MQHLFVKGFIIGLVSICFVRFCVFLNLIMLIFILN